MMKKITLSVIALLFVFITSFAQRAGEAEWKQAKEAIEAKDYTKAIKLLQEACDKENADAMFEMANLYAQGYGVEKNLGNYLKWLEQAAQNVHFTAIKTLATLYSDGKLADKNLDEAIKWSEWGANLGDVECMLMTADIFYTQFEQNKVFQSRAFEWYRKAAEAGNDRGILMLVQMYSNGEGVEQDDKRAFAWLRRAADKNNKDAQYLIGQRYLEGKGIEKNEKEGLEWIKKAAAQDHQEAKEFLKKMESEQEID